MGSDKLVHISVFPRYRLVSYVLVRKKTGTQKGYERSEDPTGTFAAISLNVIENTGASYIPRPYSKSTHWRKMCCFHKEF